MTTEFADVTVVLPAFNNQAQLTRALSSCYSQTIKPKSIVVIDDASHPPLYIPSKLSARTFLIRQETNQGPYAARNRALSEVKTKLVAFLDSDDAWFDDKIENQLPRNPERADRFFSFSNGYIGKEGGDLCDGIEYFSLSTPDPALPLSGLLHRRASFIANTSVVISLDLLEIHGPFDESNIGSDFKMWLKVLMSETELELTIIEKPLFKLNINRNSVSSNFLKKQRSSITHLKSLIVHADDNIALLIESKCRRLSLSVLLRCGYAAFNDLQNDYSIEGEPLQWLVDAATLVFQSISYLVKVKIRL